MHGYGHNNAKIDTCAATGLFLVTYSEPQLNVAYAVSTPIKAGFQLLNEHLT